MATLKKLIQDAPRMRGSLPKKAQTGIKATKDSTAYFNNKSRLSELKGATSNNLSQSLKYFNASDKAKKDKERQSKKGTPGYDANGFPKKKNGGSVKAKNGIKCWTGYKKQGTKTKSGKTVNNCVKK